MTTIDGVKVLLVHTEQWVIFGNDFTTRIQYQPASSLWSFWFDRRDRSCSYYSPLLVCCVACRPALSKTTNYHAFPRIHRGAKSSNFRTNILSITNALSRSAKQLGWNLAYFIFLLLSTDILTLIDNLTGHEFFLVHIVLVIIVD